MVLRTLFHMKNLTPTLMIFHEQKAIKYTCHRQSPLTTPRRKKKKIWIIKSKPFFPLAWSNLLSGCRSLGTPDHRPSDNRGAPLFSSAVVLRKCHEPHWLKMAAPGVGRAAAAGSQEPEHRLVSVWQTWTRQNSAPAPCRDACEAAPPMARRVVKIRGVRVRQTLHPMPSTLEPTVNLTLILP